MLGRIKTAAEKTTPATGPQARWVRLRQAQRIAADAAAVAGTSLINCSDMKVVSGLAANSREPKTDQLRGKPAARPSGNMSTAAASALATIRKCGARAHVIKGPKAASASGRPIG